jgi:quercetin dioxygenase-like cupin family protein
MGALMLTRRHMLAATGSLSAMAAVGPAAAQQRNATMKITRSNSQPFRKGPAEYFTGAVRIEQPFAGSAPARISGAFVTFEPGARTNWHTHPLGQTLIVTQGCGWVQAEGGPREEILAGDIVWFPPGVRHWHGATATQGLTHIAIAEALDGKSVDWMEKVTDAQYQPA